MLGSKMLNNKGQMGPGLGPGAMTMTLMIVLAGSDGQVGLFNHNKRGVAISGYDVVAYFQNHHEGIVDEGKKGSKSISATHKGITYYFFSEENRILFEQNPEKYLPAYGGWCAWAMSKGKKAYVDPDTFLIAEDANGEERLYLFYNRFFTNNLENWLEGDHQALVRTADEFWAIEVEEFELMKRKEEAKNKKKGE